MTMNAKPMKADGVLAAELGVTAAAVAGLRADRLRADEHFTVEANGRGLAYTEAGRQRVREILWQAAGGNGDAPQEERSEPPGGEVVKLLITHKLPNPTWISVRTPEGLRQNVRVRHGRKLRKGQHLNCRKDADGQWHCVHTGFLPRGS